MNEPTHTEYAIGLERLQALQGALEQAPEMVQRELLAAAAEADALILREVKERMGRTFATHREGGLRDRVFHEEAIADSGVTGLVATPLSYAEPVELGQKPHFMGKAGIDALTDWARAAFNISSDKLARAAAFAVATKISRVGVVGKFPFQLTAIQLEDQVRAIFDQAAARIAAQLVPGGG